MRETTTNSGNKGYLLYKSLNDYLIKNNILPFGFTAPIKDNKLDEKKLKKILKVCDGVILQGGDDFNDIDKQIARYLYDKNVPTFGICLGMQIMASAFNGNIKKIKGHNSKSKYAHFVYLNKNSKLYKIIKKKKILVNSRHNYAVSSTDLKKCAYSNEIEAIEDDNKKFYIGIQWHPENLNDVNSYKLFKAFFNSLEKK